MVRVPWLRPGGVAGSFLVLVFPRIARAAAVLALASSGILSADEPQQKDDGVTARGRDFWAFRPLARPEPPRIDAALTGGTAVQSIDAFLLAALRKAGLDFALEADRRSLIRRVSLDLTGLPPAPDDVDAFLADAAPEAYERLVERLLASPHYGERWGQQWLDAAGYSDSNGYHRNDTPRPFAYRYRDYVIRSVEEDKPYDRFLLEQLAGDELVGDPKKPRLTPEEVDALTATHFLRNGPDGTDSTEGNEMARTIERYAVLEELSHITISALFGLTIDCARCHDHKFDPIPQHDYYALQAVFYPAFNVKKWVQPKDRWIHAAGQDEVERWRAKGREVDCAIVALRGEFEAWLAEQRPEGVKRFEDDFSSGRLAVSWSATAPGDQLKPGQPAVKLDVVDPEMVPAAGIDGGKLHLLAALSGESVWFATRQSFDWTPDRVGGWIEATFQLAGDRVEGGEPAERIGYYISLQDHDDDGSVPGGNILIDGNPEGGAEVHVDYPGTDTKAMGRIGSGRYAPGHSFGVRVIRAAEDEYLLAHVVDGRLEQKMIALRGADLPDGGLGFELCCARSFSVFRTSVISSSAPAEEEITDSFTVQFREKRLRLETAIRELETHRLREPPRISPTTDLSPDPPEVRLLKRGDYFQPGEAVEPGVLSILCEPGEAFRIEPPVNGSRTASNEPKTTGRRLAFAQWATRPGSRAAGLIARVEANRIWLGHFGRGIVETPENFGARGSPPSNPELLEWLARDFVDGGWSMKRLHRRIVLSRAYRQASAPSAKAAAVDPENRLLWQFPPRRLDAVALRDSMLAAAGVLNLEMGGPPVEIQALEDGEVVLPVPDGPGPHPSDRRSIYLRHRRSQPLTFLQAFDEPAMDPNCVARGSSTVVSQALAMLNGAFAVRMGAKLAERIEREAPQSIYHRIERAFLIALARPPSPAERERAARFLATQSRLYRESGAADDGDSAARALADFARMLLASNELAYVP